MPAVLGKLIAAVVWERCRLSMRGLSFQRRTVDQISPDALARVAVLASVFASSGGVSADSRGWCGTPAWG